MICACGHHQVLHRRRVIEDGWCAVCPCRDFGPGRAPRPQPTTFEQLARQEIENAGYAVIQSGWPDFLIVDPFGRLHQLVEIKDGRDRASRHQSAVHELLGGRGLDVEIIRPENLPALLDRLRRRKAETESDYAKMAAAITRMPVPGRA